VRKLTKRFGGVVAVDGVSLEIPDGQILGLIGPNGAGKSTLLRCIVGEMRSDEGEVLLAGERIDKLAGHRIPRSGVGIAHQIPRPFHKLTTRENVVVGAMAGGKREAPDGLADVDEILEFTELADKASRPAGQLPLLDQKRLGLARALAIKPRLLLLDEVGAGLIEEELERMIALVERINQLGTTLLIVEHVEAVIRSLADHIVVLDWGRQIAEGNAEEIAADATVRAVYLGDGEVRQRASEGRPRQNGSLAKPLLRMKQVTARYGRSVALDSVDLEIASGEIVAVLGANGAGKTTLARVISGQMSPKEGELEFDGTKITRTQAHRRVGLGIAHCPEGRRIFGELSIGENLALGAFLERSANVVAERQTQVLALFPEFGDRLGDPAGTLSGGQQQMLAIGRALMSGPRLLVLDEASLGLAPKAIERVYEAISELRKSGVAVLLIEQNVYRSLALADHAYVLDHGRSSYSGAPSGLEGERRLSEAYFGTGKSNNRAAQPRLVASAQEERK
jgi:ABC-type branched-subunit amino acid transport system ATPase component